MVVLPGRAEFIEKYAETLNDLAASGFAVAILDWRGQGGSDRYLRSATVGTWSRSRTIWPISPRCMAGSTSCGCPARYLMLAHSMGGHIGLRYLHAHPASFAGRGDDARRCSASGCVPTPEPLARAMCRRRSRLGAGARYAPGQRDVDLARYVFARNRLTSCPEHYAGLQRQLAATPELALGGVTYGWLGAALRSIALTRRPGYLEAIPTPILVCQAGRERIVCNRAQVAGGAAPAARRLACSPRPGTSCCSSATRSATRCSPRSRRSPTRSRAERGSAPVGAQQRQPRHHRVEHGHGQPASVHVVARGVEARGQHLAGRQLVPSAMRERIAAQRQAERAQRVS